MERELDDEEAIALVESRAKRLPAEPLPWVRLPTTWRQWSWTGFAWFAVAVLWLEWWIPGRSGAAAAGWITWTGVAVVAAVWIAATVRGGLVDRRLASRREAARRLDPARPWSWDHRWDPRGTSGSPLRRLLRETPRSRSLVLNAVFFFVLTSAITEVAWMWGTVGGFAATWVAWRWWRIWGVGTAHVAFDRFPFHPGERVTLRFGMSEGGAHFERVSFSLRRIEEAPGNLWTQRRGPRRHFGITEHRPPAELPGPDHYVTLEFDLPEDVAGTNLSASPPAYWALDVVANTSAGPYVESFLIPVYERPAA